MRFRTEQPPHNLLARGVERDLLPVRRTLRHGVPTWSRLALGFLTGRERGDAVPSTAEARAAPGDQV